MNPMMGGMGMGMGMHPGASGMNTANTIHVVTHKSDDDEHDSRRRRRALEEKGEAQVVIPDSEFKMIEKCVASAASEICVTYYYADRSPTIDYIVPPRPSTTESRYFSSAVWNWKSEESPCNDQLLPLTIGSVCVRTDAERGIVLLLGDTQKMYVND